MNILLVGDPHLQLNRLKDGESFVNQLISLIEKRNPDQVILLGDLFDTYAVVRSEILSLWSHFFHRMSESHRKVIVLVGNHDMAGAEGGVSAIEPFRHCPNVTVIDEHYEINGLNFLPFIRKNEDFIEAAKKVDAGRILFCHQSFDGAQFENGQYDPHGVDTNSVKHLKAVVSGHVHKQQHFANVWYPGTPFQHTFGDAGEKKGIFEISVSSAGVKVEAFHELDMPLFENIEASSIEELLQILPSANSRTQYKVIAKGSAAEIAQFWADPKVKTFKVTAKRVVDALTSLKPNAQVVSVSGASKQEKLKNYVESKKWRSNTERVLARAAELIDGDVGR